MTQEKNTTSFLQYLQTVAPFLSSDMKKEALALVSLFEAFGVEKVADLSKPVLDMQKKIKNSADGFSKRVEAYFAAKNSGQTPAETAETLADDFKNMTAENIKKIAKKFDVNLAAKTDADAFANWLRTGTKPPTPEERLKDEIAPYVAKAVQIRDANPRTLSEESTNAFLAIADEIKKIYKVDGLKAFIKGYGREPIGKTAAALRKEIAGYLAQTANYRFKVFEREF